MDFVDFVSRSTHLPSSSSRMEGSEDIPVLAECHGGPFAIYSTKECVIYLFVVLSILIVF